VDEWTLTIKGASFRETARIDVYAPDATLRGTSQTDGREKEASVELASDTTTDQPWHLHIGKADEGILEDSVLLLPPPLPPIVSLLPEHAFGLKPE